jgi:hypothetical protein
MHYYIRSVQIYSVSKFKTVIGLLESSILGRLTQEFLKNYKKKIKSYFKDKVSRSTRNTMHEKRTKVCIGSTFTYIKVHSKIAKARPYIA